jgi:hypothetical protein
MVQDSSSLTPDWSIGFDIEQTPFSNFLAFWTFNFFNWNMGLTIREFNFLFALQAVQFENQPDRWVLGLNKRLLTRRANVFGQSLQGYSLSDKKCGHHILRLAVKLRRACGSCDFESISSFLNKGYLINESVVLGRIDWGMVDGRSWVDDDDTGDVDVGLDDGWGAAVAKIWAMSCALLSTEGFSIAGGLGNGRFRNSISFVLDCLL